jgi:hypothetical protein
MLIVTIELAPKGDLAKKRHLGTAYISNNLEGDLDTGCYDVSLSKWGRPAETWKKGKVQGFHRLTRGPWDLLYLALRNTVGYRNKDGGR